MPSKPEKRRRKLYPQAALHNAIKAVKIGGMGVNQAARHYGVPSTTLKRYLKKNMSVTVDQVRSLRS